MIQKVVNIYVQNNFHWLGQNSKVQTSHYGSINSINFRQREAVDPIGSCICNNVATFLLQVYSHSSEKRGLRSIFLSGEMLQNLPNVQKKETHIVFYSFFIQSTFEFYLMNTSVYVTQTLAFIRDNSKLLEIKNEKNQVGFFFLSIQQNLKHFAGQKN